MSEAVDTIRKDEKGSFVQEVREEMSRVSYPSREDVQGTTLIVIINVIFFAIFLFLIDRIWVYFLQAIEWLLGRVGF